MRAQGISGEKNLTFFMYEDAVWMVIHLYGKTGSFLFLRGLKKVEKAVRTAGKYLRSSLQLRVPTQYLRGTVPQRTPVGKKNMGAGVQAS